MTIVAKEPVAELLSTPRQALLEREPELAAIADALRLAADGRGQLVVVEGAAGLGKSRLLDAALELGRGRGLGALRARGSELEREFAFGVVCQLFEPCVASVDAEERERLFAGAADLTRPLLTGAPATAPLTSDPTYPMLHGLYWLVVNFCSGRPLVLAVDDVHWADRASLRFLAFMLPRLKELPLALIVALRPGPPAEDLLLTEVVSAPQALSLRLAPLSVDAAEELLAATLGRKPASEFAAACHGVTAGNPFFLHVLARELVLRRVEPTAAQATQAEAMGPRAVSRAVLMRLAAVPAGPALARAAAVLGERAQLREAAALAQVDDRTAAEAVDELVRAAVLKRTGQLEFVHPIVRQAVYADLGPHKRNEQHARAARVLAAQDASPERVAAQLLATEAAAERWVVETLRRAAQQAIGHGAPEAAISFLKRALHEPPPADVRAELLRELGRAETLHGDPIGIEHLRAALDEAPPGRTHAEIARELAYALPFIGQLVEAVAVLESAIEQLGDENRELALQLKADLSTLGRLHPATYARTVERLSRLASEVTGDTPAERLVLASLAQQRTIEGAGADDAAALAERAFAGGRLIAEHTSASHTVQDMLWALIDTDRFELAASACDIALADARRRGSLAAFGALCCFRSMLGYRRGTLPEAESDADAALEVADRAGSLLVHLSLALLIDARIERGELGASATALECRGLLGEIPNSAVSNFLLSARGRLRVALGELAPGTADLLEVGRREWANRLADLFPHRASAAVALAQQGELHEAQRLARQELELARAWGTRRAVGIALRTQGLVVGGKAGIGALREAVTVLEGSEARLEHARALVDLGAALRRSNDRAEAREKLSRGLELARLCGGTALTQRADDELQAAGARPRRRITGGIDALTPSERRVAALAATGLSNREIAQALFVTVKTVETHLHSTFGKLGVRSRRQLTDRLKDDRSPGGDG